MSQQPDRSAKSKKPYASQGRARRVESRRLFATSGAVQARLFLALALVLFDERCARTKDSGNARNTPPVSGPNKLAIAPVPTVAKPPRTNRMRYSCHRVSRSADSFIRMFMPLPEE